MSTEAKVETSAHHHVRAEIKGASAGVGKGTASVMEAYDKAGNSWNVQIGSSAVWHLIYGQRNSI